MSANLIIARNAGFRTLVLRPASVMYVIFFLVNCLLDWSLLVEGLQLNLAGFPGAPLKRSDEDTVMPNPFPENILDAVRRNLFPENEQAPLLKRSDADTVSDLNHANLGQAPVDLFPNKVANDLQIPLKRSDEDTVSTRANLEKASVDLFPNKALEDLQAPLKRSDEDTVSTRANLEMAPVDLFPNKVFEDDFQTPLKRTDVNTVSNLNRSNLEQASVDLFPKMTEVF